MADHEPLAMAQLVEAHHAMLYRYAYRLTGSIVDAEDLTQQTFLNAQLKLDQLRAIPSWPGRGCSRFCEIVT